MENVELGFNPISKHPKLFMFTITPEIAAYILKHHNKDNRKLKRSQVISIVNNIRKNGWIMDGGALTFNVEGNITEFQHRLQAIVDLGLTVEVPVFLGVATDSFTKTAAPKARTPVDEIQRKDPGALDSQVTTCREIISRRQARPKFNMNSAVDHWNFWKHYIAKGESLISPFFSRVAKYNTYRRVFAAWATMLHFYGKDQIVRDYLKGLEEHELSGEKGEVLFQQQAKVFEPFGAYSSPADRSAVLYKILCICADRIEKEPSGKIEFGINSDKLNHEDMRKRGYYRKFLENPDNITMNTLPV